MEATLHNRRSLLGAAAFSILYVAICLWFHVNDVYNQLFTQATSLYFVYHLFKVGAVFYLLWLTSFIGLFILRIAQKRGLDFKLNTLDRLITAFYIGGSAIAIGMFILGCLHLYYTSLILILTTPGIFFSFPDLLALAEASQGSLRKRSIQAGFKIQAILASITLLLLSGLLINKGLFPTSDHDSLTHYTQYYLEVIRNHSIAPNKVWYHYFYSKGSGLMFLGMLLVDETGQKLVSFCMVLAVAAVIFSLSKKIHGSTEWSWVAVIVYVSSLMFEPLSYSTAIFEKQHIFMSSLIVGIVFMIAMFHRVPVHERRWWTGLCSLLIIHLAIFTPTAIAFILPLFFVYTLYFAFRKRSEAWFFAAVGSVGFVALVGMLILNYFMVGIPEANMTRLMWSLANQEKFSQWVSPYLVVYLNEGSNPTMGTVTLRKNFPVDFWFYNVFHLERIAFLMPSILLACLGLAAVYARVLKKRFFPSHIWEIVMPIVLLLVTSGAATLVFNQPLSIFRYFVFTTPFLIILIISSWYFLISFSVSPKFRNLIPNMAAILIVWAALIYMVKLRGPGDVDPGMQADFLLGRISIAQAFMKHPHMHWPELIEAKQQVGNEERILMLNNDSFVGAVPGCPIESEINYGYRDWHLMVFGSAEVARNAFQKEGINYFIFRLGSAPTFALPLSPLFSPSTLNNYFDVIYAKNDTYLLTWKGRGQPVAQLSVRVIDILTEKIKREAYPDLYARVKLYFDRNHAAAYPVRSDLSLPPVKGWQ